MKLQRARLGIDFGPKTVKISLEMKKEYRNRLSALAGIFTLALLVVFSIRFPPDGSLLLPALLFGSLLVFTTTFSVFVGVGLISLLPMTTVAAALVLHDPVAVAWVAFVSAAIHGLIRTLAADRLGLAAQSSWPDAVSLAAANAAMQALSILIAAGMYGRWGGAPPGALWQLANLAPLLLLGATFLATNYVLATLYIWARGQQALGQYLRALPQLLLFEGLPVLFAPLMARIYVDLTLTEFLLAASILIALSLITRGLYQTQQRLERRLNELDSLQAVGQALSSSLRLEEILQAVRAQVARLMPAESFYVALYDPTTDEVSFPLSLENGQRRHWRPRRAGNGLSEYVIRSKAPLLIQGDYLLTLDRLGVEAIGAPSQSWLGVPLLAGDEALGMMCVQSFDSAQSYDQSHKEVLRTIAAQASVAIQNARLYARTDEALAHRVQELDSILRSAGEGILLLNERWQVLAANRALAGFLGMAELEISGDINQVHPGTNVPLISHLGYTPAQLRQECDTLTLTDQGVVRNQITLPAPSGRSLERSLTAVRDRAGEIIGWLLIFRDLSEEKALAHLRQDLTGMLVHDLRSPLSAMMGSVQLIREFVRDGETERLPLLFDLVQDNGTRMLNMIGQLLDINRLESGQMPLYLASVDAGLLFSMALESLQPLAEEAQIVVSTQVEEGLPALHVDADQMRRVFSNLLDNALKFTPDGGHVRMQAAFDPMRNSYALLSVSDDGPGIPAEVQPRLFQKFGQFKGLKGRRPGSGLGLSFCKLVVEAHQGEIWVQSEDGKGSTFHVRLPLVGEENPGLVQAG